MEPAGRRQPQKRPSCAQAFLPQLELRGGSIVNVASTSALVGAPDLAAYSATKGGVVAATRALAVELAPARIRVNAVWLASDEAAFVMGAAIVVDGGLTAA